MQANRGPKPPASARPAPGQRPPRPWRALRPAPGGRFAPAGSGAGLRRARTCRSAGHRPERAGETRCVSCSRPDGRRHLPRLTGRGHRPCHSAAPGSGPAGGQSPGQRPSRPSCSTKATFRLSVRLLRPACSTAETCTNLSWPPPSGATKPKPLVLPNRFTVPFGMPPVPLPPRIGAVAGHRGRPRPVPDKGPGTPAKPRPITRKNQARRDRGQAHPAACRRRPWVRPDRGAVRPLTAV